ncbi:hypothetical protein FHS61_001975 [Altererythrobacter atlanticus]|uniref:Uncharacterized protein n=1 Tax=Croceibacterium atlanticum TaxID=1267766 RepID=A0A0F7KQN9_9SPHN|nr:hypothetical protein [Croceibacterium atlanticum]AKH41487.1 hypothetical protein WYH_00428 [Croceibacterium atlanticum]MBB5732949.1 hypothetical protein [Croceibacterium atlanticum]
MRSIDEQLAEDRALRDSALRLFKSDLQFVKADAQARNVGLRLADRLGEGSADMVDDALAYADAHRGKVGLGLLLAGAFFARNRLIDAVFALLSENAGENAGERGDPAAEPEAPAVSSEEQSQF